VIKLHPDVDKKIRVVTIQIENNVIKSSITKVCKLPIDKIGN